MKSIHIQLTEWTEEAFRKAGFPTGFGLVTVSERLELGDYQCNGALAVAKQVGLSPQQVAVAVVAELEQLEVPSHFSIAGPGFINFQLHNHFLLEQANVLFKDPRLGVESVAQPLLVTIDFGGPNVAKPLHVGHLRTAVIGDCLQKLERFMGNTVISDVHLGDWGTQMGIVLEGIRLRMPELSYFERGKTADFPKESPVTVDNLAEIYPAEATRCKAEPAAYAAALATTVRLQAGDPGLRALWQHCVDVSVAASRQTYDTLGIHFDVWNGESSYNLLIAPLLQRLQSEGQAIESNGALIIPLEGMPPLLLLKTDGAYLYATTDLAALFERVESGQQRILYVVDQRQSLHFRQLFAAARQIALLPPTVEAELLGFGTINGSDGKPFKTRAGGVMPLSELIETVRTRSGERLDELRTASDFTPDERKSVTEAVTLASLKFADLINNRLTDYVFDVERVTAFEGKTGPYVLYTAVRIKSLLADVTNLEFNSSSQLTLPERQVLLLLH